MKTKIIFFAFLAASALLGGCSPAKPADLSLIRSQLSWASFCATYHFDIDDCTHEAVNQYLDVWCGSSEEEEIFIKAGIEP